MKRRLTIILTTVVILGLAIGLINYYQQPTFLTSKYIQYRIGLFIMETAQQDDVVFGDRFAKAADYLALSVDKGQSDKETFHKLFRCYHMSRNDEKAEDALSKAIDIYPDDFEFHYDRGVKRKELRKHKLALDDFKIALDLDSVENEQVYSAYYERGAMTYLLGDTLTALTDWNTANKLAGRELRDYSDYCRVWR